MADPLAVIIRFSGDPDDLLERFEQARRMWIDAQAGDCERPVIYAACKTEDGIAIVTGWETRLRIGRSVKGCTAKLLRRGWPCRIKSSGCGSKGSAGNEPAARPSRAQSGTSAYTATGLIELVVGQHWAHRAADRLSFA